MRLEVSVLSKPGGRKLNEDAYGIWSSQTTGACFCALSDGAGGHGGGDVASKLAVEHMLGWFQQCPEVSGDGIEAALEIANRAVIDRQKQDARLADMRATAVVLAIDSPAMLACWGHLGDSRLYCFRAGRITMQTRDHSVLQSMVDTGYVEPAELRRSAQRSTLLAALGNQEDFKPSIERERYLVQPGDVFLLCTDGLWECVSEDEMERMLCESAFLEEWLCGLESAVLARGREGQDNYSAVAVCCR